MEGLYGVILRLSRDSGQTWSKPVTLISIPGPSDCGYPASVQPSDGTIVTAYYFGARLPECDPVAAENPRKIVPNTLPWHRRDHMGVARWRLENLGV